MDEPDGTDTARVAVVLVNWNAWQHSIECLDSLLAQEYPDLHVFVVDNDSSDDSVERLASWCDSPNHDERWRSFEGVEHWTRQNAASAIPYRLLDAPAEPLAAAPEGCRVTLIRSFANLGFAGGCNAGMRAAGLNNFEFFWLLNTDTVVHRESLSRLVHAALARPQIGVWGATIRYYNRPDIVQAMAGARLDPDSVTSRHIGEGEAVDAIPHDGRLIERDLAYVMGASMFVTRPFIADIGPMQEDYFLYFEEMDWAVRAAGRYAFGYVPQSHVFHKSGASSSTLMSVFSTRLYYANRIRFCSRYFPERLSRVKRSLLVDLGRHLFKRRWTHAYIVCRTLCSSGRLAARAQRPGGPLGVNGAQGVGGRIVHPVHSRK
jgi:GT2 family glycosyltransferase